MTQVVDEVTATGYTSAIYSASLLAVGSARTDVCDRSLVEVSFDA